MTAKPNLTIDDIARELGVSKTTVSRAISGKGRISAATRERVQAYIEKHNYRPSAAAKGLAESRTYNLALLLPRDFIRLDVPFYREILGAICEEAACHDYNVMVCVSSDDQHTALTRTLDYRKVDGVILTRTVENDALLDLLASRGFPFATLGSLPLRNQSKALVEADHDQVSGCHAFCRELLRDREGRTAFLVNDLNYIVNQSRMTGFRRACQELEIPLEQTPVRIGINDPESCRSAVVELLEQGIRRFICSDEDICIRTYRALQEQGCRIPEEVELACLADCEALEQTVPPITALHFDAAQLGRAACRELINALTNQPYLSRPVLGCEIRRRGSIR